MNISLVKLSSEAQIPARGTVGAAGYDLYACIEEQDAIIIPPFQTTKIGTGIAIQIPHGYFGAIYARSGLAAKSGLRPANCVGVIDEDYTGEIMIALHNDTDKPQLVQNKTRIAQLVIIPYLAVEFQEVGKLESTERGDGGFGSTGA